MLTRRHLLLAAAAVLGAGALDLPGQALAQSPAEASAFVERTGRALAAVANGPGSTEQKKAQLSAIVEQSVDVDGVARFALGRFWQRATPAQQQQYLTLFHRVLAANITGHLGEYRGVGFVMGRTMPAEGMVAVDTTVTRPNQAPADVRWVVDEVAGQPKIVDVLAEGTSLRLTQRSDYASYLSRNGNDVQALIDAIRRQLGA
jgi:phospholipid transport system substrate-binding protein